MEKMVNPTFWSGRKVLLTGHTGFKGSWLALWLQQMGAEVSGFSLPPATSPSLFELARVDQGITSHFGDLRQPERIAAVVKHSQPEIILHLAAQALVSEGYSDPIGTYASNVMGAVHLLDAARQCSSVRAILVVTSDKCYKNREWAWPYHENEALGGFDPYSNSKACAELVTAAFRQSFFDERKINVASARAGNVFGGGDWSKNRLIPDLLAAFTAHETATLRRPQSVRPWQHVLEPLAGYLMLTEQLMVDPGFSRPFNFGPSDTENLTVGEVATRLCQVWGEGARYDIESTNFPHEAGQLRLDSSLARQRLGWRPRLGLDEGLRATVDWQKAWISGQNMHNFTLQQILDYMSL